MPFLLDKEDVFLLPKHEREVKEVNEVKEEEEIISRAAKLGYSHSFIMYILLTCLRARCR